jgi:thioester reductase-like protein
LLDELLQQTTAKIYCLVRATDPRRAWQRIRDNLADYALWDDAFADRIVPVLGDLDLPRLGLSPQDYDHLAGQIEVIYHNGAWVNFLVPYTTLKKTNVLGTQEILRLAGQGQVKPLHFISSYSVFFSRERTLADQIRETDDLSPADTLCDNGYVRSKWVAEKMVTAARERGLPVAIYRPGVLFGDSRTGISNPNDFINCMILGCMQMESVPTENALMDLCPVDFAGQAIIHLSGQPQSIGQAFHLVNPNPLSWQEWAAWINGLGYPLQAVPYNSWKARLQTALADPATRNALYPFAADLPSVKGETDNFSLSQVFLEGRAPRFDCRQTLNGLTDSGIVYPAINADLLQRYFAYFVEKGVLHPATTDPIASR